VARYASTDPWPDHPKPWYREVYKVARGHGWSLQTHTSHTGSATLRCPSGVCEFKVYATGKGAESVAKQHRLMIERCPHGRETVDALARATELLDKAERLLDALDALHESARLDNRMQALLFEDSQANEEEILELWLASDQLTGEAMALLADQTDSDKDATLTSTDGALSEARGILHPLPKSHEVLTQRTRATSLRARCEDHRKLSSHS
jgi:hypothetical protein